jgi:nucleoside-diphosphate-sugar epimerase
MKILITGASGFIGTNLIQSLEKRGDEICNFDKSPPLISEHEKYWVQGDLMKVEELKSALIEFTPNWVIHLAARTECDENTTVEEGYSTNTVGTANLLEALMHAPSVERVMVTSSQYVCGPSRQPENDQDYFPHTVYGWSKVETEKLTRAADLPCTWTIIRPVNIWGSYHARYGDEFWKIASSGLYVHPNVPAPTRTYGYIGNVIWQMLGLMELPAEKVHREVFYVGDQPIKIDKWSIGFCKAFRGKEPTRIPLWMMKGLALVGDMISVVIRRPFLITSSRLKSMTQDYLSPIDKTISALGEAPYSLDEGMQEVVQWYNSRKSK